MQPCEEAGIDTSDWYRDNVDEAYGDDIEADRDNVMVMMILVTNGQLCDQSLGIWSSTSPNQHPLLWSLLHTEQSLCILHTWKCTLRNTPMKISATLHNAWYLAQCTAHHLAFVLVQHVAQAHWPGIFRRMNTMLWRVVIFYAHVQSHGHAKSVHKSSLLSNPPVLLVINGHSNWLTNTQPWQAWIFNGW